MNKSSLFKITRDNGHQHQGGSMFQTTIKGQRLFTRRKRPAAGFGRLEERQIFRLLVVVRRDLVDDVDVLHRATLEKRFRQIQTLKKQQRRWRTKAGRGRIQLKPFFVFRVTLEKL